MATLKELYALGRRVLSEPQECLLLTQAYLHADRRRILLEPDTVPQGQTDFLRALEERQRGTPIQYILGHWEFDGLDLAVRPGVLIPREDTIPLVEAAAEFIGGLSLRGLDLCAGTGAVALATVSRCPNAQVEALELYPEPLACLQENTARYGHGRVRVCRHDVLLGPGAYEEMDFILSNPPYIASGELPFLQEEVLREPSAALDGGEDGLTFYRVLTAQWAKILAPGGLLAVEIGDTQSAAVERLFQEARLREIHTRKDLSGHDRVVLGLR